jgi:hypothetical protein
MRLCGGRVQGMCLKGWGWDMWSLMRMWLALSRSMVQRKNVWRKTERIPHELLEGKSRRIPLALLLHFACKTRDCV